MKFFATAADGSRRWHRRRKVLALHAAGHSVTAIARATGWGKRAIAKDHRHLGLVPNFRGSAVPVAPPRPPRRHLRGLFRYLILAELARSAAPLPVACLTLRVGNPESYRRDLWRADRALRQMEHGGAVVRSKTGRRITWAIVEPRTYMTTDDAKNLVSNGTPFGDVIEHVAPGDQPELREWYVRNPSVPNTAARERAAVLVAPVPTGDVCRCGGMLVRTGTCYTCQGCGDSSGGCG